jgi:hypothetical protein
MNLPSRERDSKKWPSMESGWSGFKIGSKFILMRQEGPMVKLCLRIFDCKMCNTKQGTMTNFNSQFVYRRILGVVCRLWNNGSAMLSKPGQEPTMEIVAKYEMGKRLVGIVI